MKFTKKYEKIIYMFYGAIIIFILFIGYLSIMYGGFDVLNRNKETMIDICNTETPSTVQAEPDGEGIRYIMSDHAIFVGCKDTETNAGYNYAFVT